MSAVGHWLADRTRSASTRREAELEARVARARAETERARDERRHWTDRAETWAAATGQAMAERDAARDALRALTEAVDYLETSIPVQPHHARGAVLRAPHVVDPALAVAMRRATDLLKELDRG